MAISVQRPSPVDVTKSNPVEILYGNGDATTDGTHRFIFDSVNGTLNLEKRSNDVFNLGALRVGGDSVLFGVNLRGGAEGRFWVVNDLSTDTRSFMPGFEVFDSGSNPARIGDFIARVPFFETQPDFSVDTVHQDLGGIVFAPSNSLTYNIFNKTGSTAATADVVFILRRDGPTGGIVHEQTFPASTFGANLDITLEITPPFDFVGGQPFFSQLVSDDPYSLLGDSSGNPYFALDLQPYFFQDLISTPLGTDRFLIDNLGDVVADNAGNLILDGATV